MKFYFVTRFMHKLKVSNKYKCNSESKLHESKFFRSVIPRNSRNANIIFSPKWSHKITHCTMQVLLLPTEQRDQDHRPSAQKPSNPSQQSQESQWCRHKMQESQAITLRSSQRCKWCRQTDGGDKECCVLCKHTGLAPAPATGVTAWRVTCDVWHCTPCCPHPASNKLSNIHPEHYTFSEIIYFLPKYV